MRQSVTQASALMAAVLFISTVHEPTASAQPKPSAEITAVDRATELFTKGKLLYRAGRRQEAYEAFQRAWELHKSYDIAANLGVAELALGKPRSAAEHLSYALRMLGHSEDPKKRDALESRLADARKETAALRIQASEPGALVLVDGAPVGRAPLLDEVFVDPGRHTVEAEGANQAKARMVVDVSKGASEAVILKLTSEQSTRALPGASTAGTTFAPAPATPDSKSVPLLVVGYGASALAAGIAVAATVISFGEADTADELRSRILEGRDLNAQCWMPELDKVMLCDDLQSTLENQDLSANVALYGFIAAGVLSAATTVYALWPTPKPASGAAGFRLKLLPTMGRDGVGAILSGEL
jgi:PEGA domain